jgi:hypothetical protein
MRAGERWAGRTQTGPEGDWSVRFFVDASPAWPGDQHGDLHRLTLFDLKMNLFEKIVSHRLVAPMDNLSWAKWASTCSTSVRRK